MQATNQGIIEAVKTSKSGKTLGVLMKDAHGNEQWHSTKHFELGSKQGAEIQYNASQSEYNGSIVHWLNDYQEIGTGGTTADQAFQQLHANYTPPGTGGPPPMGSPQPPQSAPAPQTNKDCSIIAQALTKACTAPGDDVNKVWARYCSFYRFALKGVPDSTTPPQTPSYDGFEDQEIPF